MHAPKKSRMPISWSQLNELLDYLDHALVDGCDHTNRHDWLFCAELGSLGISRGQRTTKLSLRRRCSPRRTHAKFRRRATPAIGGAPRPGGRRLPLFVRARKYSHLNQSPRNLE